MFDEDAILQIRGSCKCEGGVDDENCSRKKLKTTKFSWLFFDVYQHSAKPHDEADQPRST